MTDTAVRPSDPSALPRKVAGLLEDHDPSSAEPTEFLGARFDAGLAWVHFPEGVGGLDLPRREQASVDRALAAAGAPDNRHREPDIGLGMAAPTIATHGTREQQARWLRPLFTGEELWCQLFSEPGAGSDLAGLATKAVQSGDDWTVDGQKVWTSNAHNARWAILLARTDVAAPRHRGLTFFVCDMTSPGVKVRPLRLLTGEGEFNEVFLTGVRIPDSHRLGDVGQGWRVAQTTLGNERVTIGGEGGERESGILARVTETWRGRPDLRTPSLHDRVLDGWVAAQVQGRLGQRIGQLADAGALGPEGSAAKLGFAALSQRLGALEMEIHGAEALRYDDWTMTMTEGADFTGRNPAYRYLRARGNSIEGGTSEILRNVIAERVLGLPREPGPARDVPWKDLPR